MPKRPGTGPPIFVGGCPRSGTTLLRTMLDSHPHLAVPLETHFVVPAWRHRSMFGDLSEADNRRGVARWIIELRKSRYSDRIGIPREQLMDAFAAAPPTLGSLMESVFTLYAEREGKPRWGDKRPSYSQNLNVVFDMWPNARFVNVVRDPRACVASMRKAFPGWGRPVSAVEIWERTDRNVRAALRKLPADQITEIRYEDLIADPEGVLKRLCAFYDLDPAHIEDMLAYHTGEYLPTGQIHENAGKPVSTDSLERWSTELDEADIGFIEHVLADQIRHHGYELSGVGSRGTAVDYAELKKVRTRRRREEQRRRMVELKRKVTYRQPTASALPTE
jgi:hypothetical protein